VPSAKTFGEDRAVLQGEITSGADGNSAAAAL
jgi:hypothetical protein